MSSASTEHVVPRYTFASSRIKKGYHNIRNTFMPAEKLFFSFHVGLWALLSLCVTAGDGKLCLLAQSSARLAPRVRGAKVWLLLDAGAAQHTDSLLTLAETPNQLTLVRTPRRPSYRKQWQNCPLRPGSGWRSLAPPPRCPRSSSIAQTVTQLRDTQKPARACAAGTHDRGPRPGRRGKERWHALWVFGNQDLPPYRVGAKYRQRQQHEQRYRILLHDAFVDCGALRLRQSAVAIPSAGFPAECPRRCTVAVRQPPTR